MHGVMMESLTDYQFIKLNEADRTVRLTLARPPLNVLNIAMLTEINNCLESLIPRRDMCVLVIDGEGRMFSSGVDVPEHQSETIKDMIGTFHRTFRLMHKLPMPTVAAIHGGAYGGAMELAIFCDMVLAADDVRIGVPEITLGVFPPLAVAHLSRIIGIQKAAELVYTGTVIDAHEASRIGLVNHVFATDRFREEVDAFARKFSRLSAYSLRATKTAFRNVVMTGFDDALRVAEEIYLKDLMAGDDPTEGLSAFMEKRAPEWRHQ